MDQRQLTSLICCGPPSARKAVWLSILLVSLYLIYSNTEFFAARSEIISQRLRPHSSSSKSTDSEETLSLPVDYVAPPPKDDYCERTYGLSYLRQYASHHNAYCDPGTSMSGLECFEGNVSPSKDPFCIAQNVILNPSTSSKPLSVDCTIRNWSTNPLPEKGVLHQPPNFYDFPPYMFDTGPRWLFDNKFDITNTTHPLESQSQVRRALSKCSSSPNNQDYTILIKRDGGAHHWHSLMEFFSLYLTLDILRMTINPATGQPYWSLPSVNSTRVVILDSHPDGAFFDLWNMFAGNKPLRLEDLQKQAESSGSPLCLPNVIVPIPGAANPMWQGDWEPRDCTSSALLDTFVSRVMGRYNVTHTRDPSAQVVLTFVDRRHGRRKLHDREAYLQKVQEKFPHVKVQSIDFGEYTYAEQIRIASETDVLVGVHGAGLTLQMYMPPGSSVVEVLPFNFIHRGFRNEAKLRGHRYFNTHAEEVKEEEKNWQDVDEIVISENRFVEVVSAAVWSMGHRGLRTDEVN